MITFLRNLFCSSLGKKYLMAGSGIILVLFVVGHMVGNLQFFLSPEAINRYGNLLQSNTELLWPVRCILFGTVLLHIWSATRLTLENRAARPIAYTQWEPTAANYASRTMMISGVIIATFIIYHILHYTVMTQAINLTGQDFKPLMDSEGHHDIHKMMVIGFSNPFVAFFYLLGVGLLCLHLSHGISAMFQTMGWKKKSYAVLLEKGGQVAAAILFVGYSSIPISVLLRLVR